MKVLLYSSAILVSAAVGWQVGDALLPPGAELETAIYPVLGAIAGAIAALIVIAIVAISTRDDL